MYKLREAIRNVYPTIQYKRKLLYLHEGPSLVGRFVYILEYVYYIFCSWCSLANCQFCEDFLCVNTSQADTFPALSGASYALFELVGKWYNCLHKNSLKSLYEKYKKKNIL